MTAQELNDGWEKAMLNLHASLPATAKTDEEKQMQEIAVASLKIMSLLGLTLISIATSVEKIANRPWPGDFIPGPGDPV